MPPARTASYLSQQGTETPILELAESIGGLGSKLDLGFGEVRGDPTNVGDVFWVRYAFQTVEAW